MLQVTRSGRTKGFRIFLDEFKAICWFHRLVDHQEAIRKFTISAQEAAEEMRRIGEKMKYIINELPNDIHPICKGKLSPTNPHERAYRNKRFK